MNKNTVHLQTWLEQDSDQELRKVLLTDVTFVMQQHSTCVLVYVSGHKN